MVKETTKIELRNKIVKELKKKAICSECKLYYTNEANKNKCIKKHQLNVNVRWDLIIDILDEVLDRNYVLGKQGVEK